MASGEALAVAFFLDLAAFLFFASSEAEVAVFFWDLLAFWFLFLKILTPSIRRSVGGRLFLRFGCFGISFRYKIDPWHHAKLRR